MQGYLKRNIESIIKSYIKHFPVTAILGPRQCGKSTLIKEINKNLSDIIYLDLQSDVDIAKLKDP
ncbi:MAG: AAA family ATPase [Candidatus Delongbacteria bacterium]|nr:AAA family ATPase [Candidatus Delongbacteria bacterium]MCG2761363.1 AAA family ATPase [Candidatus Delongbacteria bacterium]